MDRHPAGFQGVNAAAWRVAKSVAAAAREQGAGAVVLAGSFARGEAHAESDLDLYCIGDGPAYELSRAGGLLVSVSWATEDEHRDSMRDPGKAGAVVPGWRGALTVADASGAAERLSAEARAWSWDVIGADVLDGWVVEQLTGYAEEAHKLAIAIERGHTTAAAVQRSLLATRLAPIMSVHLRLLYDSENTLWDMVNERLGSEWTRTQSRAWGLTAETFPETCAAALGLWLLATAAVLALASERQRAVIDHARGLASAAVERLQAGR